MPEGAYLRSKCSKFPSVSAGAKNLMTPVKIPPPAEGHQSTRLWKRRRAGRALGSNVNEVVELKRQGLSMRATGPLTGYDRKMINRYLAETRSAIPGDGTITGPVLSTAAGSYRRSVYRAVRRGRNRACWPEVVPFCILVGQMEKMNHSELRNGSCLSLAACKGS